MRVLTEEWKACRAEYWLYYSGSLQVVNLLLAGGAEETQLVAASVTKTSVGAIVSISEHEPTARITGNGIQMIGLVQWRDSEGDDHGEVSMRGRNLGLTSSSS